MKEILASSMMEEAAVSSVAESIGTMNSASEQQLMLLSGNQSSETNATAPNSASIFNSSTIEKISYFSDAALLDIKSSNKISSVFPLMKGNLVKTELQVIDDMQASVSAISKLNKRSDVSELDLYIQPEGTTTVAPLLSNVLINTGLTSEWPSISVQLEATPLLVNHNKENVIITTVDKLASTNVCTEETAATSNTGKSVPVATVVDSEISEESEGRPGHSVISSKVEPSDRDSSDSGLGSAAPDSDDPDDNTFLSELIRQRDAPKQSSLKRKHKDELEMSAKREKKSVRFDGVTVLYFPRAQGFSCVPSQGGSTLGMDRRHTHADTFTLAEHAIEQRRAHRVRLQQLQAPAPPHSDSSDSDSDSSAAPSSASDSEGEPDGHYLQPIGARQRRAVLRAAGVRRIDPRERDACRDIRASRELCGCACRGECAPPLCACSHAGVTCQVDRMGFPCGCTRESCANPAGRLEFNPLRVQTHFVRTLVRLGVRPPLPPLHHCPYPDGRFHTYSASTFEEFAHPAHVSMFRQYEQLYAPPPHPLADGFEERRDAGGAATPYSVCVSAGGSSNNASDDNEGGVVEISRQVNPHQRPEDLRERSESQERENTPPDGAEDLNKITKNIVESAIG